MDWKYLKRIRMPEAKSPKHVVVMTPNTQPGSNSSFVDDDGNLWFWNSDAREFQYAQGNNTPGANSVFYSVDGGGLSWSWNIDLQKWVRDDLFQYPNTHPKT